MMGEPRIECLLEAPVDRPEFGETRADTRGLLPTRSNLSFISYNSAFITKISKSCTLSSSSSHDVGRQLSTELLKSASSSSSR